MKYFDIYPDEHALVSADGYGPGEVAKREDVEARLDSARDVVQWLDAELRLLIDLRHPALCPYCGEDNYGVTEEWDELEPCATCLGQKECRHGEGYTCVVGCPACLGCDTPKQEVPDRFRALGGL